MQAALNALLDLIQSHLEDPWIGHTTLIVAGKAESAA